MVEPAPLANGDVLVPFASMDRRQFLGASVLFFAFPAYKPRSRSGIVCLGDSISDTLFFPHAFPSLIPAISAGESGDTTAMMLARCQPDGFHVWDRIPQDAHTTQPGRYTTVMGGTNDLFYLTNTAGEATHNLGRIYAYLRERGATPIPMTILPSSKFSPAREAVRVAANAWIREQPHAVDCEPWMAQGNPPILRPQFDGGDHVHPTGKGPWVLAQLVKAATNQTSRFARPCSGSADRSRYERRFCNALPVGSR